MRTSPTAVPALVLLALSGWSCGPRGPAKPTREAVTAQLQQEADRFKREGEKLDPVLRVTAHWDLVALEVNERPNDPDKPWAGSIRFKIRSETKDSDGKVLVDEFEKRYDYIYTMSVNSWVFQMAPS
jgi:hypothetical protein